MAEDHFIAQTYLKRFTDADGKLHAYRKSNGQTFAASPQSVCREWNGDFNPEYLARAELLGDFRKIYERHWNPVIDAVLTGAFSQTDRFVVAAHLAALMIATPTAKRCSAKALADHAKGDLIFAAKMQEIHGISPGLPLDAIDELARGNIAVEFDAKYAQAMTTRHLLSTAVTLYHQDWISFQNEGDELLITSDNPAALWHPGGELLPPARIFPITPRLCMCVPMDPKRVMDVSKVDGDKLTAILQQPPRGKFERRKMLAEGASGVNRMVAECAEDFVFSSAPSSSIAALVKEVENYRLENDYVEFPTDGGAAQIQGSILRVRKRN